MGVEENKKTVQMVQEAWVRGDLDSLDQHFAPNFDNSQNALPGVPPGLAGAKMIHPMSMASFPDRANEILDMIGEGNKVMARIRVTGTNEGGVPWMGADANDAKIDFESVSIYEFDKKGKITKSYGLNDVYMLGIQLGVITPPEM